MTLGQMADYVTGKVGQTDTESVAACKEFIKRRYQLIWDAADWRDTLAMASITTTANSSVLLLPIGLERIHKLRVGDLNTVSPFDIGTVFDFNATLFDNYGTPAGFLTLPPAVLVSDGLTTLSVIMFGSAGVDTGKYATLEFEDADGSTRVLEDINISTGTEAPWPTVSAILRFNKPLTTNYYQLYFSSSNKVYVYANEVEAVRRVRIKLLQGPSTATACLVSGKRICSQFGIGLYGVTTSNADNETPLLRNIEVPLLDFAQADMLERQRQYAKSELKLKEAQVGMQAALALEKEQSAQETRIIPAQTAGGTWYADDSFGASSKSYW